MLVEFFEKLPLPFKMAGQFFGWIGGQWVSAHPDIFPPWAVNVAGIAGVCFLLSLFWYAINYIQERRGKSRLRLDSQLILILCLLGALGSSTWQWWRSNLHDRQTGSSEGKIETPVNKTQTASVIAEPRFVKDIQFSWDSQLPLGISIMPTSTVERLRFYVDVSPEMMGSSIGYEKPQFRAQIEELRDVVKGQRRNIQLLYKGLDRPLGIFSIPTNLYWGDPKNDYPVADVNRARIVVIGADGSEQSHYFEVLRLQHQQIKIISSKELEWINLWKEADTQ